MQDYDRIDFSKRIDINKKKSALKEFGIYHHWYLLNKWFKFQKYVCNGCHDISMLYINLDEIAFLSISRGDYRWIINEISKGDSVNVLQNVELTENRRVLWR